MNKATIRRHLDRMVELGFRYTSRDEQVRNSTTEIGEGYCPAADANMQ